MKKVKRNEPEQDFSGQSACFQPYREIWVIVLVEMYNMVIAATHVLQTHFTSSSRHRKISPPA